MKQIKEGSFIEEVEKHPGMVLLDFSASWCGPCKMLMPTLLLLSSEYNGKIKFVKMDIDEAGEVIAKFGVYSVPCLVLIKDGKEVSRLIGNQSVSNLRNWFQ